MKITNIVWDTDDDGTVIPQDILGLPDEVDVPDSLDLDDVADYLSDEYGFCVISFSSE